MDSKERFFKFLTDISFPKAYDWEFLYRAFSLALDGATNVREIAPTIESLHVNYSALALYLINEHVFFLTTHPDKKEEDIINDEGYLSAMASVALDKYCTNEHLAYQTDKLTSRFSPYMSTLDLYLNFILGMLGRYRKNEPDTTLIVDVMSKGFNIAKCVATLLEGGFETEAFSTWRTLHENECILHVLVKNGKAGIDNYLRHMKYAAAFRGAMDSKALIDQTFVEIKERMHAIGLKSKDMKRFIEYGWLVGLPGYNDAIKLNFRDGVESMAGLSEYSKIYEMSSEIAHSSPLLIYSRKGYIFHVVLLNLYESFMRLEKIFSSIYMSTISKEEADRYAEMRRVYFWEIRAAHRLIQQSFAAYTTPNQGDPNED